MDLIEVGKIVNTHGIRGEIKLNPWTDDINDLVDLDVFYKEDGTPLAVENSKVHKNVVVIKFKEIATMNDAEHLKGTTLYTEKIPLPEGRYYIKDLIGLDVFDADVSLGKLTDVFNTGANDIYEVTAKNKQKIYLPVIDGVINEVDLENKKMLVTVPAGLLED